MKPVIILFAKAPVPGHVKTRLLPAVSPAEAALLHTAFVWDMIEKIQQIGDVECELHTDTPTHIWDASGLVPRLQRNGDLQLKLLHGVRQGLHRHEAVFILGSDAPALPVGSIKAALGLDADVVLGPTEDGGYWGILCKQWAPGMFEGVEWSSGRECAQTAASCRLAGLTVAFGETFWDVDYPADLHRLAILPNLPRHTAQAILATPSLAVLRPHS